VCYPRLYGLGYGSVGGLEASIHYFLSTELYKQAPKDEAPDQIGQKYHRAFYYTRSAVEDN